MPSVDMSARAVTARLREVSELRRLTLDLERAGRAAGIENGVVRFRPGNKEDLRVFANESPPSHLLCVDLGFAKSGNRSCGLAVDDEDPQALEFDGCAQACVSALKRWANEPGPTALIVEAPLSMKFDLKGNPEGRLPFERSGGAHRYWYETAGAATCLAAQIFLTRLRGVRLPRDVEAVVFEGFLTFKDQVTSDQVDAKRLRDSLRHKSYKSYEVEGGVSILENLFSVPGPPLVIEPCTSSPAPTTAT